MPKTDADRADFRTDAAETRASIFSAVREQLGLHLQGAHAPVQILTVNSLQKPTGN